MRPAEKRATSALRSMAWCWNGGGGRIEAFCRHGDAWSAAASNPVMLLGSAGCGRTGSAGSPAEAGQGLDMTRQLQLQQAGGKLRRGESHRALQLLQAGFLPQGR